MSWGGQPVKNEVTTGGTNEIPLTLCVHNNWIFKHYNIFRGGQSCKFQVRFCKIDSSATSEIWMLHNHFPGRLPFAPSILLRGHNKRMIEPSPDPVSKSQELGPNLLLNYACDVSWYCWVGKVKIIAWLSTPSGLHCLWLVTPCITRGEGDVARLKIFMILSEHVQNLNTMGLGEIDMADWYQNFEYIWKILLLLIWCYEGRGGVKIF